MAGRFGHLVVHAAMMCCVLLWTSVATSQEQGEGEGPTDAARVLDLVKNANDEFDRGEYVDALRLYQKAYSLYPEPVLLYRIGLAAEKAGQTRLAIDSYQQFVEAAPEGDATAEKTAQHIVELKASLPPRLTVQSNPPGAEIFLNTMTGEPVGVTPVTVEVPTGEQVVHVRLEGYRVAKETVELKGGEDKTISLELSPLKRLASTDPNDVTIEQPAPEGGGGVDLGLWGYVAGATGVALIGTGVAFSILSSSKTNDVNTYDKRAPGASREELESMKDQATTYYETSVATYIAGGVLTAAGVVLILLDGSSTAADEGTAAEADATGALRFDVAPLPGGGWVGFSGQF